MKRKLKAWLALPRTRKVQVLEAAALLALARLMVRTLPFHRYSGLLGRPVQQPGLPSLSVDETRVAEEIGAAIAIAARHVPWQAACLPQAMAGGWMLRLRGLPALLQLGAAKPQSQMQFHAWLHSGNVVVSGGETGAYAVIASFEQAARRSSGTEPGSPDQKDGKGPRGSE